MAGANSLFSGEKLLTHQPGEGNTKLFPKLGFMPERANNVSELSVDAMAMARHEAICFYSRYSSICPTAKLKTCSLMRIGDFGGAFLSVEKTLFFQDIYQTLKPTAILYKLCSDAAD